MLASIGRVLVVYKKSLYQLYVQEHREPSVRRAIARRDPAARRLARSHDTQRQAMELVERTLDRRGLTIDFRWRGQLRSTRGYDLVIAVGGDGTVLDTAHRVQGRTPLLGINSDPGGSVGQLCAGTADQLDALLDAIEAGRLLPDHLTRIRARVDGHSVLGPCLNDVLFAHRSPAEMSRFDFAILRPEQAEQANPGSTNVEWKFSRNSGIWLCTATGSPAAMRSAGGTVMPQGSRRLQYLVREPYVSPDEPRVKRVHGFIGTGHALVLANRMRSGRLWGDGVHRRVAVHYGQTIVLDCHPSPLCILRHHYRS